jgi:hypothetical protein
LQDPNPVQKNFVTGEIVSVSQITPNKGMGAGVHMILNTGKETLSVHLGPSWYLENQDVKIETKDKVEAKGSKITFTPRYRTVRSGLAPELAAAR